MEVFKKLFVVFLMVAFTAGCATKSDNIKADSVSPLAYQGYSCDQVGQEMLRVGRKVSEMAAQQDATATKDAVSMGVGLVIFWPSLFFLAAGEDNKKEIARLKGESDALEQIAITKNCTGAIVQRDAALAAWKEEQQKKNETGDALVEAKYEECVNDFGESSCDRQIIKNKMRKEKEKNVANSVTKEPSLSSKGSLPQITALEAGKEEHQKKNETDDALVEAKYQECVSDFGDNSCNRRVFEDEVKKEKEKNVAANVTKEPSPPSKDSLPQIAPPISLASQQDNANATDVYKTKCPFCGNVFTYQEKYSGQRIHCMRCDHDFDLP